jgi:predicted component of type VI protein secretion system
MNHAAESTHALALKRSTEELFSEIQRYLGAVALFRELGHEPNWRAEALPSGSRYACVHGSSRVSRA